LAQTSRTGVKVRRYSDHPLPWRADGGPRNEFERAALVVWAGRRHGQPRSCA
jgi:hypothetical protein